jgi:hypothetical protein
MVSAACAAALSFSFSFPRPFALCSLPPALPSIWTSHSQSPTSTQSAPQTLLTPSSPFPFPVTWFHRPEPPPLFGTRERPDLAVLEQRRCPAGVLHAIVGAGHPEPYHATTTTIPITISTTTARSLALPRCASTDMSDGEERARTTLRRSKIPRINARTMTRPH